MRPARTLLAIGALPKGATQVVGDRSLRILLGGQQRALAMIRRGVALAERVCVC